MRKRRLMEQVRRVVAKAGPPVAEGVARTTAKALRAVDGLRERLPTSGDRTKAPSTESAPPPEPQRGRKTVAAASAKRATQPARAAQKKKGTGFKVKRGQKHRHHR